MITTRRSTLGLLGGALAMPYLIRPAFAQSTELNVTTYDKFLPDDFVAKFEKDTGIKVNIRLTDDQGKQYNLLAAEGDAPSTDIVTVTGHRLSQFIGGNLLAPLDVTKMDAWSKGLAPAYEGAPQLTSDGKVYGVPLLAGYEGLVLNTENTEPTDSWGVLFDDKYAQMITYILSDTVSLTMKYMGYDGDFVAYDGKPDEAQKAIDAAQKFLIEKKKLVRKYYDAGSEVQQMLINEDAYVAQAWSGPAAKLIMDGQPMSLSVPKEGTYGFLYSFNLVNNAPHADAAYKLFDAILSSPEVGASMTRASGFASALAGVSDLLNDTEKKALTLPDEQAKRITFYSSINRAMKNEMIDAAVAAIKAA